MVNSKSELVCTNVNFVHVLSNRFPSVNSGFRANTPHHLEMKLSGEIISDISDHFTQFCIISSPSLKSLHYKYKKKMRSFSNFSEECFLKELSNLNFSLGEDVDQVFSNFYKKKLIILLISMRHL